MGLSLVDSAHGCTDAPATPVAQLDGKPIRDLQKHRLATKRCFNIAARSGRPVINAASNGYWLMLKPLPKGTHTLQFGGELPSLRQAITYTLLVQ